MSEHDVEHVSPPARGASGDPEDGAPRGRIRPKHVLWAFLAVIAAWGVREVLWWRSAEFGDRFEFRVETERTVTARQPDGENGWPLLLDALSTVRDLESAVQHVWAPPHQAPAARLAAGYETDLAFDVLLAVDPGRPELYEPEDAALRELEKRGTFEQLDAVARASTFVRPMGAFGDLMGGLPIPELAEGRNLCKALAGRMRLAAHRGDRAVQLQSLEQSLAVARAIGNQTFLVDRLVGIAIQAMMFRELRHELIESPLDAETGRAMLAILDRQAALPTMTQTIETERLLYRAMTDQVFTDDGHGDGRLRAQADPFSGMPPVAYSMVGTRFLAGRAETMAIVDEYFDLLEQACAVPPTARGPIDAKTAALLGGLDYRTVLLQFALPTMHRALSADDDARGALAATRTLIALETFRAEHGHTPEALDELVPDYLPALPDDPAHGGAYVYRRIPADEHGRDYLLLSTGVDQTEDTASLTPGTPAFNGAISEATTLDVGGQDVLYNSARRKPTAR